MPSLLKKLQLRFPPILLLLSLLSAFPPLATDMYLPALPSLQEQWHTSFGTVNLTLVAFFLGYCFFLLIYGPLSDYFGRRPPLLVGIAIFVAASLFCAFSDGVVLMIIGRFLQGTGASSASAIVFAISKDRFAGTMRQKIFVQIGAIVAAAPLLAPVLGGWLLKYMSWRWIFLIQSMLAIVAFVGVWRMQESLPEKSSLGLNVVFHRYVSLLYTRGFVRLLFVFTLTCIPLFAFIGGSADIYMHVFGFSAQRYGYFFGLNASALLLAPALFNKIVKRIGAKNIITLSMSGMVISSFLMIFSWLPEPWRLTFPMFCFTFCFGLSRPVGNNLILEEVEEHAGAASSLMVFFYFMTGSLSMRILANEWQDKVQMLGLLGGFSAGLALLLWFFIGKRMTRKVAEQQVAQ